MPAIPSWLLEPLWDQFVVPLPDRPVHDPAPRKATRSISRAALACRTNARHNTFNRLQRCHERREEVIDAFFDLTEASSTVRNLIRQGFLPPGPEGRRSARRASAARQGRTGRAPGDLVAEPLPGEDLRGDLLPLAGAGRLDPAMAPAAWKLALALSRSPLPRGSVEGT